MLITRTHNLELTPKNKLKWMMDNLDTGTTLEVIIPGLRRLSNLCIHWNWCTVELSFLHSTPRLSSPLLSSPLHSLSRFNHFQIMTFWLISLQNLVKIATGVLEIFGISRGRNGRMDMDHFSCLPSLQRGTNKDVYSLPLCRVVPPGCSPFT